MTASVLTEKMMIFCTAYVYGCLDSRRAPGREILLRRPTARRRHWHNVNNVHTFTHTDQRCAAAAGRLDRTVRGFTVRRLYKCILMSQNRRPIERT